MATYIVLCNFTEQGIRNVKETTNRAEAVKRLAREFNVTMKEVYWTLGNYDLTVIFEAADEMSVTALCLAIGAQGNVRTQMMRAFNADEMRNVLTKVTRAREAVPA
jgi:uncharacterized protein with GYD domain